MNFRITTSMMMNTYQYNLQNSTYNMNNSRTKIETTRKFNSYAEDPAAATHAWRLRRSLMKNDDYQSSNTEAYTRFQIAYATLETSDNKLLNGDAGAKAAIKYADNDPTGGARQNLGTVISELADSLIFNMNSAKYGDHFVFSGNDEMNVPFSWSEDGQTLLYRGVNVSAGGVEMPTVPAPEPAWGDMKPVNMPETSDDYTEQQWINHFNDQVNNPAPAGSYPASWGELAPDPANMPDTGADETEQAWIDYYTAIRNGESAEKPTLPAQEPDWGEKDQYGVPTKIPADVKALDKNDPNLTDDEKLAVAWRDYYKDHGDWEHLQAMADERVIMDLGMGMKEEGERDLIDASAFNRTIPGIEALGYGVDEDGDPKNIAVIMKRLAKLYSQCDYETGDFCDENGKKSQEVEDEVYRLLDKFGIAHDQYNRVYADVSARSEFLQANGTSLKDQGISLQEQIVDIENVDPARAISDFLWDYTCYNAALKVGTQILSQSLIDYMS